MDGEEEVGLVLVGDAGALVERDDAVVAAGEDDARVQPFLEGVGELAAERQRGVLLQQPGRADGADFLPAVPGIDDDGVDAGLLDRSCADEGRCPRRRGGPLAKVDDDAEGVVEPVGVGGDVGGGELDAQVAPGEGDALHVRVVVGLLGERRAELGLEAHRVRPRLLDDAVLRRRADVQDDFGDALDVGDRHLHADDAALDWAHLQQARARVPDDFEVAGAG